MRSLGMNCSNSRLLPSTLVAGAVALLLVAQRPATAQVIYSTGFENPPFARGSGLVGQDGWITPPPFSPGAAVIVTEMAIEGRQTVRVRGGDLVPQDFIDEVTDGYYATRSALTGIRSTMKRAGRRSCACQPMCA